MTLDLNLISPPTRETSIAEIEAALAVTFDDVTLLNPIVQAYVDILLRQWQEARDLQDRIDIDFPGQFDWVLNALGNVIGLRRRTETRSEASVALTGDPSVLIPINTVLESIIVPEGTGVTNILITLDLIEFIVEAVSSQQWSTLTEVRLLEVPTSAEIDGTFLDIGDRFSYEFSGGGLFGEPVVYEAIVAGVFNLSGNPDLTLGDQEFYGPVLVCKALGIGTAAADVRVQSTDNGPIEEEIGAYQQMSAPGSSILTDVATGIIRIVNAIDGFKGAINLEAADIGKIGETNSEYLTRMKTNGSHGTPNQSGRSSSFGETEPIYGLQDTLGRIPGVISVKVEDNQPSGATMKVYILGGDDDLIALEILNHMPFGVTSIAGAGGTLITKSVKRDDGRLEIINFNEPISIPVAVQILIAVDSAIYLGNEAVRLAVQTLALNKGVRPLSERFNVGEDPSDSKIKCAVMAVTGVTNALISFPVTSIGVFEYVTLESVTVDPL